MFKGTLYEKQKLAAEQLINKKKHLLAWEQGLGKTVISIGAAEKLIQIGHISSILVLAPGSFLWQWSDALDQFSDTSYTFVTAKDKDAREYHQHNPYTLLNWNLFVRDWDILSRKKWDCIIADEAQILSNHRGKTPRLLKRLNTLRGRTPTYRWALTGTAISNKLEDLYSIMYWVDKDFLPPWDKFEEDHIVRNPATNQIVSYRNLKPLNEYLQHRMDRKTRKDMRDQKLPQLVEKRVVIPKDKTYAQNEKALLTALDKMVENAYIDSEGSLQGVRPNSKTAKAFHKVKQSLAEPKLSEAERLINEIIEENNENRVVVFSFYKAPLRQLGDNLRQQSWYFTGDQTSSEKRTSVHQFRDRGGVLLCSNAGARGLDLPWATHAIHLDIPFSHEIMDQRNKRITRTGAKHDTSVVFYLMMEDSMEQYYYVMVKAKGNLASAVLDGTADSVVIKRQSLRSFIRDNNGSN